MDYAFLPQPMQHALKQRWLLPSLSALLLLGFLLTLWTNINTLWLTPADSITTPFRAPTIIDVQQLAKDHVLGAAANMSDLPLASLGITLKGIFFDSQNAATAVVAQGTGPTTNYHAGDQLAPNIVIVRILPDSVIIKHNGNLERLAMPIQPIEFSQNNNNPGLWNNN
jgi:type II secretory pathway component PulC